MASPSEADTIEYSSSYSKFQTTFPTAYGDDHAAFSGSSLPLASLQIPSQSFSDLAIAQEMFESYMKYTRFTVPVWVNYDAASKLFHTDQRIEDTGKLRVSPSDLKRLENMAFPVRCRRVSLQIGTAFKTLFEMLLTITSTLNKDADRLAVRVRDLTREHSVLYDHLLVVADHISQERWPFGTGSLTLQDLHAVASSLILPPDDEDLAQSAAYWRSSRTRYGYYRESWAPRRFMFITEDCEDNPGYLGDQGDVSITADDQ